MFQIDLNPGRNGLQPRNIPPGFQRNSLIKSSEVEISVPRPSDDLRHLRVPYAGAKNDIGARTSFVSLSERIEEDQGLDPLGPCAKCAEPVRVLSVTGAPGPHLDVKIADVLLSITPLPSDVTGLW